MIIENPKALVMSKKTIRDIMNGENPRFEVVYEEEEVKFLEDITRQFVVFRDLEQGWCYGYNRIKTGIHCPVYDYELYPVETVVVDPIEEERVVTINWKIVETTEREIIG